MTAAASPCRIPVEKPAYHLVNQDATETPHATFVPDTRLRSYGSTGVFPGRKEFFARCCERPSSAATTGAGNATQPTERTAQSTANTVRVAATVSMTTSSTEADLMCAAASPTIATHAGRFCSPR